MTIYYTAKDIEEMAAKGIRQIEVGPGITLTDFARETAQQLDVVLVDSSRAAPTGSAPAPPIPAAGRAARAGSKYNKPSGCMHGTALPTSHSQAAAPSNPASGANASTVNRLIDLMGNAIKRGS